MDEKELEIVDQLAIRNKTTLVEAAIALGFLSEARAYAAFADWMQRPFVDLTITPPQPTAAHLLPERVARLHQVVAIAHDNRTMTYASATVFDAEVDRDVVFASGRRARMVVAPRSQILQRLGQAPGAATDFDQLIDRIKVADTPVRSEAQSLVEANDSPVADLCTRIIAAAVDAGASDIHIEPGSAGAAVRQRISGILEPMVTLPRWAVRGVTNRFKLLANADISVKHRPQDGAFHVTTGQPVDVRLSTIPTIHGEKIVMRVILGASSVTTLDTLGYDKDTARALTAALSKPDGLVLVTGPTGSGKTTVLYAALHFLKTGRVNIVTVEDPVERQIEGVTQVPVNSKTGNSFAAVLRSVMRQDPNIIMVGEIRDSEVAEIVGQAAFTGHLVLSTLHTTDAASAITRLLNLGLQPFKVAESLNAVVAQRLLRKLCPNCAVVNDADTSRRLGQQHGVTAVHSSAGKGCDWCKGTGFQGRVAVPEILVPDDRIRNAIRSGGALSEIRSAMRSAGSPSMRQSAMRLVAEGVTSIEEVNRVLTEHVEDTATREVPAPVAPPPSSPVPSAATAPAAPPANGARSVVVAEDDRMVRMLLRMLFEKEGFTVIDAEDGATGIERVLADHPALVIVDLQMPGMDGYRLLEAIRADEALSDMQVLVLTAEAAPEVESKVLEMGADDYVAKPFEAEVLMSRVRAAFRRAARHSRIQAGN